MINYHLNHAGHATRVVRDVAGNDYGARLGSLNDFYSVNSFDDCGFGLDSPDWPPEAEDVLWLLPSTPGVTTAILDAPETILAVARNAGSITQHSLTIAACPNATLVGR